MNSFKIKIALNLVLLIFLTKTTKAEDIDASSAFFKQDYDTVITPTKTVLPVREVPNSVSIIESETIEALGLNRLIDIFRLIPGFRISSRSGNDNQVTYHGNNAILPRRLQVLIDSKPLLRSSYATLRWDRIPLNINQIQRIEIVRGSTTATHGTNSFLATINIVTKSSDNSNKIKLLIGSEETNEVYFSETIGNIRLDGSYHENHGFDKSQGNSIRDNTYKGILSLKYSNEYININSSIMDAHFQNEPDVYSSLIFTDLDYKQKHFYFNIDHNIDVNKKNSFKSILSWDLREYRSDYGACAPYLMVWNETSELGRNLKKGIAQPDISNIFTNGELILDATLGRPATEEEGRLLDKVNQRIQAETVPRSFAEVCGYTIQNHDEYTSHFELQHIFSDGEVSMINFLGVDYADLRSEVWLDGNVYNTSFYLASNLVKSGDKFTYNLGARIEWPEIDSDTSFASYRAGVNYHLNEQHTIRLTYAKSYRTPDVYESKRKQSYLFDFDDDLSVIKGLESASSYFYAESPEHLNPEKLRSTELGLYTSYKKHQSFDFKVFYNELSQLISEPFYFFDFTLSNNNKYIMKGAEIDYFQALSKIVSINATLSYIDNGSTYIAEKSNHSDWAGSLTGIIDLKKGYKIGAGYMGNSQLNGVPYDNYFINLTKTIVISDEIFKVSLRGNRSSKKHKFIDDQLNFTNAPEYNKHKHVIFSVDYFH